MVFGLVWATTAGIAHAAPGGGPLPEMPNTGSDESVSAVWFDGRSRLFATTYNAAHVLKRGGTARTFPVELGVVEDADGYWSGVHGVAVLAARDGWIGRYGGVGWELERAPLVEGDTLSSVAVDGNGKIYCVGAEKALYVRDDDEFRVIEYPDELEVRTLAAASSPGGQLYIVGRDGMILHFDGREFERMVVVGLSAYSIGAPWYSAWYSPDSDTLWVRAGKDRLLAIDVDTGAASEYNIPVVDLDASELEAGFTAIDGVATGRGDRLVMAMGRAVYVFESGRFRHVSTESGLVYDMALIHDEEAVYVATQSGLHRRSLRIPAENRPMRPLTQAEQRRLEELERRERRAANRRWDKFWAPTLRAAAGPVWHLRDADPVTATAVDAGFGVMLTPVQKTSQGGPTFWVWPEVLYTYNAHADRGGHFFTAGVGLGFGTHLVAAYYAPRFGVGSSGDSITSGFRHGLSTEVLWGVIGAEVSHQINFTNRGPQHAIRLLFGINIAPIIWLIILNSELGDGEPRDKRSSDSE